MKSQEEVKRAKASMVVYLSPAQLKWIKEQALDKAIPMSTVVQLLVQGEVERVAETNGGNGL